MKVAVIRSQILRTPTEIYEVLHGNSKAVLIVGNEPKWVEMKITNPYSNMQVPFIKPLTRKERRKLNRKNK